MRIGIDARNLYSPTLKGIGVYVQNLLPQMAALDPGNEFVLLYDTRQKHTTRLPAMPGFTDRGISIRKGDTFYAWEQVRLPIELKRIAVDLYHGLANTVPLASSCPRVATVHDTKALEMSSGLRRADFYQHRVQRWALRRVDQIICDSLFTKRRLLECTHLDDSRVHVVHLGIAQSFRVIPDGARLECTRHKYSLPTSYILFAGGESAPKNITRLLEAFSILKRRISNPTTLVVPGIRNPAILAQHQKEAAEYGITDSVIFVGYVPEEDLIDLYNSAQFLVYPSLWEGFGFPPLEAMACGLPVAAANATSIPEVVGEAALLFDPNDAADMAAHMLRLLSAPELRHSLRELGFKQVKKFNWAETASRTLDIYHASFGSHHTSRVQQQSWLTEPKG
jgi:glycosyltransferase involved in cell wall biosynthesis